MDKTYKIQVNYTTKDFLVEGDEKFVEKYYGILSSKLESTKLTDLGPFKEGQDQASTLKTNVKGTLYDFEDGEVHLFIKKVPGASKAEQTVNLACLYAYFMYENGIQTIDTTSLRGMCEDFGCLDKKNFGSHIKSASNKFIITGSGMKKTMKINKPGLAFAETILTQLQDGE